MSKKEVDESSSVSTGEFRKNFYELCKQQQIGVPIALKPLRHRRPPPNTFPTTSPPSRHGSQESLLLSDSGSILESAPKLTKPEIRGAKLFLEWENPDLGDSVTQMAIRGWEIDDRMFRVLSGSCLYLDKLNTLTLWNVGIRASTFQLFLSWLSSIPNLKKLSLDNNPSLAEENFHVFLKNPLTLQEASFRYCNIADAGALLMGKSLGCPTRSNPTLIKLNLTGNKIGDAGAIALAHGLRMNDTLLILSLAGNKIGDKGAEAFADMLSSSELTAEELRQRRFLLFEQIQKDPTFGKDRIASARKETLKSERSEIKVTRRSLVGPETLEKRKLSARSRGIPSIKTVADYVKPDTVCDPSKITKPKDLESIVTGGNSKPDNTLLYKIKIKPDEGVFLCGNFILLSLNLARNQIGSVGSEALGRAVTYQLDSPFKSHCAGLLRLVLTGNLVDPYDPAYVQLTTTMEAIDPLNVYVQNLIQAKQKNSSEMGSAVFDSVESKLAAAEN